MLKSLTVASTCLFVLAAPVMAADLMLDEEMVAEVDTGFVNSVYFQILGGVTLGGEYEYSLGSSYDLDAGYALAGTLGVVVVDGLSVELDVLHTYRTNSATDNVHIATTSVMGNVKYTVELNDMFNLYGAVGLGLIAVDEIEDAPPEVDDGSALGYQVIVGASADVAENIAVLAEFRYQNAFDGVELSNSGVYIDVPTAAVLVGAKLAF